MPPPSPQDHRNQARTNERFYQALGDRNAQYPQWAMVALFYTALHEVQAFLIAHGQRPDSHRERKAVLRRNRFQLGNDIGRHYRQLRQWSEDARYRLWQPTSADLQQAEQRLAAIRGEVARLISSQRQLLPP